ncbi:MAG TPA: sigma-54-dependent Fis family transcriptional regulator, partial [Desulfobacteraceae bacterium]|nr:sigma-54-dependent Fis family transcriptional regulator [Desulfobacteraceae bacterium]
NPVMQSVFEKIRSVAPTRSTVLLTGETGTGKGVLAGIIHRHSNRRDKPFIRVHCGAIPDTLLESELFGHEKGAFTGAVRRKLGKFQIAHGGTIFLDEIGTLTPAAQVKLLQILQDGTFQRVGGEETIQVDVRVISATNANLEKMCELDLFRKDLYYRLNVFPIQVPPLRERTEDIFALVNSFIRRLNRVNNKEITGLDPAVLEALKKYPWPGNIRELENLIERAHVLESSGTLTAAQFPETVMSSVSSAALLPFASSLSLSEVRRRAVDAAERAYLEQLLAEKRGKIKEAAETAGITTRQLHKLMGKHGLRKEAFKSPPLRSNKQEP